MFDATVWSCFESGSFRSLLKNEARFSGKSFFKNEKHSRRVSLWFVLMQIMIIIVIIIIIFIIILFIIKRTQDSCQTEISLFHLLVYLTSPCSSKQFEVMKFEALLGLAGTVPSGQAWLVARSLWLGGRYRATSILWSSYLLL